MHSDNHTDELTPHHMHGHHEHAHAHEEHHLHTRSRVLTIRMHSGISGDMFLAGLARMAGIENDELNSLACAILPEFKDCICLERKSVHGIGGWHAHVTLPHVHEHRTLSDIEAIIQAAAMEEQAKEYARTAFRILAEAEGTVHGKPASEIAFHEVGALDSILDTCLACTLFTRLSPDSLTASPLPIADGRIACAHGVIPVPAPAVLELLHGMAVCPFPGTGETVTPTGIALLRTFKASFGPWPAMQIDRTALVYGTRIFEDVPNGTVFAIGDGFTD